MQFSLALLLTPFVTCAKQEPFKLNIDKTTLANISTSEPFPLKFGIIAPEYLRNQEKSFLGQVYSKIYPFDVLLTLDNVDVSEKYEQLVYFGSGVWPLREYHFDPKVEFVLNNDLPAGNYKLKATFTNPRKRKLVYEPAYSPVFKISKGSSTKYDALFERLESSEKDAKISLFEQTLKNGTVLLRFQQNINGVVIQKIVGEKNSLINAI